MEDLTNKVKVLAIKRSFRETFVCEYLLFATSGKYFKTELQNCRCFTVFY